MRRSLLSSGAMLVAAAVASAKVNYDGFHVYRINSADDSMNRSTVFRVIEDHGDHVKVAVAPDQVGEFEAAGLDVTTLSTDLGAALAVDGPLLPYRQTRKASGGLPPLSWFDGYHAYADHLAFIGDIQAAAPNNSEIISIGNSFEGRPIKVLHLWGAAGRDARPAIYLEGTTHAREWISAPVNEYLAYQVASGLLSSAAGNSSFDFLNNYDYYIIPVSNPDGFVYTQTTDRMWRKNRQIRAINETAIGTDTNRNWPYQWDIWGGADTRPWGESYRGEAPGDTPEVQAMVGLAQRLNQTHGIKLFIDFHSWGKMIMIPYGYSVNYTSPERVWNYDKQVALSASFAAEVGAVYNTKWWSGTVCRAVGYTSGGSSDYMQDVAGSEISWGIELRGYSATEFALPPEEILPSGEEQWVGLQYLLKNV